MLEAYVNTPNPLCDLCRCPAILRVRMSPLCQANPGVDAATLINTAGFSFLALTTPGYKGPAGEMAWGGVRFGHANGGPGQVEWVRGVRLWNIRIDT